MNLPKVPTFFRNHICRLKIQKNLHFSLLHFLHHFVFSHLHSLVRSTFFPEITHFQIYFHALVSLKFHYFYTIFSLFLFLLLKPNSKFLYKIFKNTHYPLRRSKMPLKSILSLRLQILPKDISNPFYV